MQYPQHVMVGLSASATDFQTVAWPRIAQFVGGGTIKPVEAVTADAFANELDGHRGH